MRVPPAIHGERSFVGHFLVLRIILEVTSQRKVIFRMTSKIQRSNLARRTSRDYFFVSFSFLRSSRRLLLCILEVRRSPESPHRIQVKCHKRAVRGLVTTYSWRAPRTATVTIATTSKLGRTVCGTRTRTSALHLR